MPKNEIKAKSTMREPLRDISHGVRSSKLMKNKAASRSDDRVQYDALDRLLPVHSDLSSFVLQAALYALCPPNASESMSVVSAAPYYSVERNVLSNKIEEMEVERNTLSSKVQYMEAEFSSKVNNMEAQQAQLLKMFEEFRSTKTSST